MMTDMEIEIYEAEHQPLYLLDLEITIQYR